MERGPKKRRGCLFRLARAFVLFLLLLLTLAYFYLPFPFWGKPFNGARHGNPPLTPAWALEPWLWEDDVNTRAEVERLLAGYRLYDIPAQTILIDSPWSLRYNDFEVDTERYPNPEEFFTGLEDQGYRVVLWMTCMVNSENDDTAILNAADWFEEAAAKGYVAARGKEFGWWKGRGGFIDYTNPEAMDWWRGMQQQVFDWGIDGWKLDGTATFFSSRLFGRIPMFYQRTASGWMTTRRYMDHYYRDEYAHGLTQNPEFITLARSIDSWAHPEGFAPIDSAPVTWVGDQDHTWGLEEEGLEEALDYIIKAAKLGYAVIGSDVGGYGGAEIPGDLYVRWAQFSAFCGLFLNGGHGNRAIWEYEPEHFDLIRKAAWLHSELVPYIYSHVVAQHEGGPPLMRPAGDGYDYFFGDAFFVAPIHTQDGNRAVTLPPGRWRNFHDDAELIEGPTTISREWVLDEFPVFVREGAIVPMNIQRDYTGFGDSSSEGAITLNIYPGDGSEFEFVHPVTNERSTIRMVDGDSGLDLRLEGAAFPCIFSVRLDASPAQVFGGGSELAASDWSYDSEAGRLRIGRVSGTTEFLIRMN